MFFHEYVNQLLTCLWASKIYWVIVSFSKFVFCFNSYVWYWGKKMPKILPTVKSPQFWPTRHKSGGFYFNLQSKLPLSKRYLTMIKWPSVTAECKAVCPNSSLNSRLAPLSRRACTTDRWPCRAARCSGVFPSLFVASILAPIFRKVTSIADSNKDLFLNDSIIVCFSCVDFSKKSIKFFFIS